MTDKEKIDQLTDEVSELEDKNRELQDEIIELEKELEDTDSAEPYQKVLEQFADHGNWTGNTWTPVFAGLGEHPADMANRVLTEN